MAGDSRGVAMARLAAGLATATGIDLPDGLLLWQLAGGRPPADPVRSPDPGRHLGEALEAALSGHERRRGAHYTPAAVADRVAAMGLGAGGRPRPVVVDPSCGGGALLLAAGARLVKDGLPAATVARDLLWAADLDPLAAAVTEAAIALWSGGSAPAPGHVVAGDTLRFGRSVWPATPPDGFDVVVGNPPFQGQLARSTTRPPADADELRTRYGSAVTPYVDTAALFLLAGVDLARHGGRVAMIQPQSTIASRDAGGVRAALASTAGLLDLWVPDGRVFAAAVHVCVPVLAVGSTGDGTAWAERLATARGVPELDLDAMGRASPTPEPSGPRVAAGAGVPAETSAASSHVAAGPRRGSSSEKGGDPPAQLGDLAQVLAGFRDEYYGLVPHVREAAEARSDVSEVLEQVEVALEAERAVRAHRMEDAEPSQGDATAPLATSGLIDVGLLAWGQQPVRFAKQRWVRPVVDVAAVRAGSPRLAAWVDQVLRPKLVVASQTRALEAALDRGGSWMPVTPVVCVIPHDPADLDRLLALVCAPPVSVWAARQAAGTALSADAIRVSAGLLARIPLPADREGWDAAASRLAADNLGAFAVQATEMYGLTPDERDAVLSWWCPRVKLTWPPPGQVR